MTTNKGMVQREGVVTWFCVLCGCNSGNGECECAEIRSEGLLISHKVKAITLVCLSSSLICIAVICAKIDVIIILFKFYYWLCLRTWAIGGMLFARTAEQKFQRGQKKVGLTMRILIGQKLRSRCRLLGQVCVSNESHVTKMNHQYLRSK